MEVTTVKFASAAASVGPSADRLVERLADGDGVSQTAGDDGEGQVGRQAQRASSGQAANDRPQLWP